MSDRKNYHYRQLVTEAELDESFDGLENADRDLAVDTDLMARTPTSSKAEFGGIMWGFYGAEHLAGGLHLLIYEGVAYDEQGRRVHVDDDYTIDISEDGSTTVGGGGATSGGSSIDPGTNKECWVTIFAVFDRNNTDPRYDGYNDLIYFDNEESFHFEVVAGTAADLGTLTNDPAAEGASARIADKVLILDCLVKNTAGDLSIASVNTEASTRRDEWFWNVVTTTGVNTAIQFKGNIRDVTKALLELYNDHVSGLDDKHAAGHLTITPTSLWADGNGHTYTDATTVFAALEAIVEDLNTTAATSGTELVGNEGTSGSSLTTPDYATPFELSTDTLRNTLIAIKEAINGRVFRGGDETIAGALAPSTTGIDLGTATKRWDAYIAQLSLTEAISDIQPDGDDTRSLGTASTLRWQAALGTSVVEKTMTVQTATGKILLDSASLGLESAALVLATDVARVKPTAHSKGLELDGQDLPDILLNDAIGNQSANHLLKVTDARGNSPIILEAGGRIAMPQRFYDDFNYRTLTKTDPTPYYTVDTTGASSDCFAEDSCVRLKTDASATVAVTLKGPTLCFDTTYHLWRFFARVRAGSEGQADRTDFVGFKSASTPWRIGFMRDFTVYADHNWHTEIYDGSVNITEDTGVTATGAFHNLGLWVLNSTDIVFAVDDITPIKKTANSSMATSEQFWVEAAVTGSSSTIRTLDLHAWEWFTQNAMSGTGGGDPTSASFG